MIIFWSPERTWTQKSSSCHEQTRPSSRAAKRISTNSIREANTQLTRRTELTSKTLCSSISPGAKPTSWLWSAPLILLEIQVRQHSRTVGNVWGTILKKKRAQSLEKRRCEDQIRAVNIYSLVPGWSFGPYAVVVSKSQMRRWLSKSIYAGHQILMMS